MHLLWNFNNLSLGPWRNKQPPSPFFFSSNNVIYSKCMKKNQEYIAPVLNSICQSLLHDSLFLFPKFVIFHNHFHTSVYKKCFSYAVFHLKYWN